MNFRFRLFSRLIAPLLANRKDRNEAAWVDAMSANAKYPQVVIDYLTPKIAEMNDENEDREESED